MVLGHSHPELTETIREQAARFVHQSSWYVNPAAIEFAELIASTLPGDLSVTQFAVTGSEANEIAMRMAIGATGRFDILSAIRGLHGGSLAAEAVTSVGGHRRRGLGPLTIPAKANVIIPPFYYRAPVPPDEWDEMSLALTEQLIEHSTTKETAGILLETVLVAGGMIVPSKRWLQGIQDIAKRWGALLILDEAQLAPGRTGKMWGFEHFDLKPDVVTFAKGMSAGFAVCGAVTSPALAEQVTGHVGLPWAGTYPQDPLACAVGLKQLQIVLRDGIVERCGPLGEYMRRRLATIRDQHECVGDTRGIGIYHLIDVVKDKKSKLPDYTMAERIRYNAAQLGVILIVVKNFIRLVPPSIITEEELDEVFGRLEHAIKRAEQGLPRNLSAATSSSLSAADGRVAAMAAR